MNEVTTYRWSFEEDVTRYAEAGYKAMGVWRQKLSDFGEEKGAELLAEVGMAVSNLAWAGGFTGTEGRSHGEAVEDAAEAVRVAGLLSAGSLVLYTGPRGGHTRNHSRRLLHEALKTLLPLAEEHNVRLALEPMHPGCAGEWTFLTCLAETLELLDQVNHPRLGLVFDTYHMGFNPKVFDLIPSLIDRLFVVHLGDGHAPPDRDQDRTRLGLGSVPLRDLVTCLTSSGYAGDFDVELIGEDISSSDYSLLLSHSLSTFTDLLSSPVQDCT